MIKEYHFYISDDRMHDTHYVQHCFDIIYGSLKTHGVVINQHWIWSDGCAGQLNLHDHSSNYAAFIKNKY